MESVPLRIAYFPAGDEPQSALESSNRARRSRQSKGDDVHGLRYAR